MMISLLILFTFLARPLTGVTALTSTGHSPKYASDYISCEPGPLNVILAAPHGGAEEPDTIPDRTAGCYIDEACVWSNDCGERDEDNCEATTVKDSFTLELTQEIAAELEEMTGLRPTMSINLLHRKKLDANRDINEATFGEALAVEAWEAFHACINESKVAIEDSELETGLFVDLHGHGHPNDWAELGYLFTSSDLNSGDLDPARSSLYFLSTRSTQEFETVLRGSHSFGRFLEDEGYWSVPSPETQAPGEESYFSGGYNTRIHGSRDGGRIDSVQIESAFVNRDTPNRPDYARAIAASIVSFMEINDYPMPSRK